MKRLKPPKIAGFRQECEMLAAPETFEPEAFRGNEKVPQAVCNFVLVLALIYNDCKDAIYAHIALDASKPDEPYRKSKVWGAITGAQMHALRVVTGLLHELLNVIRANEDVLSNEFFVDLVRHLSPKSRDAWQALVSVAQGATPTSKLGKQLLLIRNKASFHYDGKAIFTGYARHFLSAKPNDDRGYVSRGASMRTTRFYFADAAGSAYFRSVAGSEETETLQTELEEIVDRTNYGLMMIVGAFIQRRGFSFRQEPV